GVHEGRAPLGGGDPPLPAQSGEVKENVGVALPGRAGVELGACHVGRGHVLQELLGPVCGRPDEDPHLAGPLLAPLVDRGKPDLGHPLLGGQRGVALEPFQNLGPRQLGGRPDRRQEPQGRARREKGCGQTLPPIHPRHLQADPPRRTRPSVPPRTARPGTARRARPQPPRKSPRPAASTVRAPTELTTMVRARSHPKIAVACRLETSKTTNPAARVSAFTITPRPVPAKVRAIASPFATPRFSSWR